MHRKILEKDVEQFIFENSPNYLRERGFYCNDVLFLRQLTLGRYGVADLVGVSYDKTVPVSEIREIDVTVYELKQNSVDFNTLLQALGYFKAIQSFLDRKSVFLSVNYSICIIGRSINSSTNWVHLLELAPNICCYTYEVMDDGLFFHLHFGYDGYDHPRFPTSLETKFNFLRDKFDRDDIFNASTLDDLPF